MTGRDRFEKGLRGLGRQAFVLALVLACAVTSFTSYASKTDIDKAEDKKGSLEEQKQEMEQTLKDLESLKSDTQVYVKKLDQTLAGIQGELEVLEQQIGEKELSIEQTQADLEAAKQTETDQYESMKLRIRYMYEKGETNYLDLLLRSQSMSELLNRAEYISQISEYDRNMLLVYQDTKNSIAQKEAQLQAEHQELLEMQEETKRREDEVESLISAKTKELAQYESKISVTQEQIEQYQKDIEAQEQRIKEIEAEIKRKEEEAKRKAQEQGKTYVTKNIGDLKLIWPCPSSSRITSQFGGRESPVAGASSNHKGVDIGASTGADILAAASGEVTISTYSYSAGNYIMINHGGGIYTVYMHASKLLVSVGDQVKQGDVIAKVGSTGYSTGPHLHFGIRLNGEYVNPLTYVSP